MSISKLSVLETSNQEFVRLGFFKSTEINVVPHSKQKARVAQGEESDILL